MGPPSYMWSVVDQNIIMWRMTVHFRGRTDPCPWPPRGWQQRWLLAYLSLSVYSGLKTGTDTVPETPFINY